MISIGCNFQARLKGKMGATLKLVRTVSFTNYTRAVSASPERLYCDRFHAPKVQIEESKFTLERFEHAGYTLAEAASESHGALFGYNSSMWTILPVNPVKAS